MATGADLDLVATIVVFLLVCILRGHFILGVAVGYGLNWCNIWRLRFGDEFQAF